MSNNDGKKPDSILAEYLDELLSADETSSPWVVEHDSGGHGERDTRPVPPAPAESRRKRAGARRPQRAPVRVAERSNPKSFLVSPAFREAASESPEDAQPDTVPEAAGESSGTEAAAPTATVSLDAAPEAPPEKVSQETAVDRSAVETAPAAEPEAWHEGRPPWAQEGFECLIFRVAGLQLAVPLVLLGQIHRLESELTPLVGRPDWFMGLLRVGNQNVRVTDTALWVMPDRYRREFRDGYRFVIQLGNSAWGLACDEVAQSFRVQPEDVKWRSQGGRRQWLAGTIKREMCALLDVARMADLLEKAESERHPDLDR